jgi:hypothetical protein
VAILPPLLNIYELKSMTFFSAGSEFRPADYNVVISYTGAVAYIPHVRLSTTCPVNLSHFPLDSQTCIIKFGSWTNAGDVVSLLSTCRARTCTHAHTHTHACTDTHIGTHSLPSPHIATRNSQKCRPYKNCLGPHLTFKSTNHLGLNISDNRFQFYS